MAKDIEFNQVRDPMYKYSKGAEKRFMQNAYLAFLLKHFSSSKDGAAFIEEKFGTKGIEYCNRMMSELY